MKVKRHVNIRAVNVDAAATAALQIRRDAVVVVVVLVPEGEVTTSQQTQKVASPQARRLLGDRYRQQLHTLLLLL